MGCHRSKHKAKAGKSAAAAAAEVKSAGRGRDKGMEKDLRKLKDTMRTLSYSPGDLATTVNSSKGLEITHVGRHRRSDGGGGGHLGQPARFKREDRERQNGQADPGGRSRRHHHHRHHRQQDHDGQEGRPPLPQLQQPAGGGQEIPAGGSELSHVKPAAYDHGAGTAEGGEGQQHLKVVRHEGLMDTLRATQQQQQASYPQHPPQLQAYANAHPYGPNANGNAGASGKTYPKFEQPPRNEGGTSGGDGGTVNPRTLFQQQAAAQAKLGNPDVRNSMGGGQERVVAGPANNLSIAPLDETRRQPQVIGGGRRGNNEMSASPQGQVVRATNQGGMRASRTMQQMPQQQPNNRSTTVGGNLGGASMRQTTQAGQASMLATPGARPPPPPPSPGAPQAPARPVGSLASPGGGQPKKAANMGAGRIT